jgi:poly(3-hydroxybutyrate) depolymerase
MTNTSRRLCSFVAILFSALVVWLDAHPARADTLPALGVKLEETSVSGLSSGAYMAGQFHVAYSSIIKGAGLVAGGPYACAESLNFKFNLPSPPLSLAGGSNATTAQIGCMQTGLQVLGIPDPNRLAQHAQQLASKGLIDPLTGLSADRVYIYTGKDDRTVLEPIASAGAAFYQHAGVLEAQIKFVKGRPGGHAFLTDRRGATCEISGAPTCACGVTQSPFINNCQTDQACDILQHIYGQLMPKSASAGGEFVAFEQREFTATLAGAGMSDTGVVYVPASCRTASGCRVHIAFHGCKQNRDAVGDAFVRETGFAHWADTNQLVVLFPQVRATDQLGGNPLGCWDWFGYLGADFLTKQAPQIVAIKRMLDRLAAPHGSQ